MHKCFEKFKVCMHYSLLCEQIYSHCVRKYVHVHAVHARAFGTCILRITFLQCWCMFMQSINAWKTTKNIHLNQERTNDPLKLHTSGQESMESQPLSFFSHQNQGIFAASISNIDRNVRVKVLRFSGQATASRSYWCQNERRSKKHRTYNLTEWNGRNKNAILGTPNPSEQQGREMITPTERVRRSGLSYNNNVNPSAKIVWAKVQQSIPTTSCKDQPRASTAKSSNTIYINYNLLISIMLSWACQIWQGHPAGATQD